MIFPRLVAIALRKYTAEPETRSASVRMLLRNAVLLCIEHIGRAEAGKIVLDALNFHDRTRGNAA